MSKPLESLDSILRKRIKVIGEDCHTYYGYPQELINELEAYITERERLARINELKTLARKHYQCPIPELALLHRIAQLQTKEEVDGTTV